MEVKQIREPQIIRLIERIGEHYRTNIANRFIRPALLQLPMDKSVWDLIESLTEKTEQYQYQGVLLDDLYRELAAAAQFVAQVRRDLLPNLRSRAASFNGPDKVLRDMAVNAFGANVQIFVDLLNELYLNLVEIDKASAKGRIPLYSQMTELQNLGDLLIGV